MSLILSYIKSIRPATLLLALACACCGAALGKFTGSFHWLTFILTLLTASSLQILSNLANDYGDYQKGTDQTGFRIGPKRAIQNQEITIQQLTGMLVFSVALTIVLGLALLFVALASEHLIYLLFFVALGSAAIWAAIKYTAGKNPYGYRGLGDLFTLIFFGPVGFVGGYFLQTHQVDFVPWLPGFGFGLLTVLVLNVNNMRDLDDDKTSGKRTIAVMLGAKKARFYHAGVTLLSFLFFVAFNILYLTHWYQNLYLLAFFGLFKFSVDIYKIEERLKLVPYLKRTVLWSFIVGIAFSIFINL